MQRSRNCPVQGACPGRGNESSSCRERNCPTWSNWSHWSDCSESCGSGSKQRSRSCPIQGACVGEVNERQHCWKRKCPANYSYGKAAKAGSSEFKKISWRRKYGPANPSDSCSISQGGALSHSFKHHQFAKDNCETHKCDIITELSNGRFEIGSTTNMEKCDFSSENIRQQWIKD